MVNIMKNKILVFLNDSFWSILGLMIMNVVAQFLVYPTWASKLGTEDYGNVLYLLSIMNIISVSIGLALNNSRIVNSINGYTLNGDYNSILLNFCIVLLPICGLLARFGKADAEVIDIILYWILICITTWRYYCDIEYRLTTNYKGYFIYYIIIAAGYILGNVIFLKSGIWQLALIPGEFAGVIFVIFKGSVILPGFFKKSLEFQNVVKQFLTLVSAQLLSNLIFNLDRVVLKICFNGTAVTIYYISSLLGKTASLVTGPFNSVIIGHLSKYKGRLEKKNFVRILILLILMVILGTFCCVIGSMIIIGILYPEESKQASQYFIPANLSSILYFASGVFTTILLRFSKAKYQVYINIIYTISFIIAILFAIVTAKFQNFVYAVLAASTIRFAAAICFGITVIEKNK